MHNSDNEENFINRKSLDDESTSEHYSDPSLRNDIKSNRTNSITNISALEEAEQSKSSLNNCDDSKTEQSQEIYDEPIQHTKKTLVAKKTSNSSTATTISTTSSINDGSSAPLSITKKEEKSLSSSSSKPSKKVSEKRSIIQEPTTKPAEPTTTAESNVRLRMSSKRSSKSNLTLAKDYDYKKRKYLVGLNLFNRKPELGIQYLIGEKFLDSSPRSIAEFLFNRNCLSKQVIGEYISNTQDAYVKSILREYVSLIDLSHIPVDEALRKFQSHFRMPGEAQKIEHLTQTFSSRFIECNRLVCKNLFVSAENTLDVLAYAIILLNTTIHNPNVKPTERMKFEQFLKMTKGIDNGKDIDREYLQGIYERVREHEFKPSKDHTTSVMEFEKNIVGQTRPPAPFAMAHRRLVCLVQLYEILDLTKRSNLHARECFLFNDILIVSVHFFCLILHEYILYSLVKTFCFFQFQITKIVTKKKDKTTYSIKHAISLKNMSIVMFNTESKFVVVVVILTFSSVIIFC